MPKQKSHARGGHGKIALFEDKPIRRVWDEAKEKWYFSVIDVIEALTNSDRPRKYWSDLKMKLQNEGSEVSDKIGQLKMLATDRKMRETDAADLEAMLRLIQSIPSKKAEPLKLWLAKVGQERIQEITDPERGLNRARENWQRLGRSGQWIQQRMMGQEIRNKLTDYWQGHEISKQDEYAILTNIIHQEWTGLSVKGHKQLKDLKTENLRDHMDDAELVFTALAELSTRQIAESIDAFGLEENKVASKKGGNIAKKAREDLEQKTGKKVVTGKNFLIEEKKRLKE